MDDLESYEPRGAEVLSVEPGFATVYLPEASPSSGDALAVTSEEGRSSYLVARRRLGRHKVRAMHLGGLDWLEPGQAVEATGRPAGIRIDGEEVDVRTTSLEPKPEGSPDDWVRFDWETPTFSEIRGTYPALETGLEPIDCIAPLAEGGTNLVVDMSESDGPGAALLRATFDALSPVEVVRAPTHDDERVPDWVDRPVRCGRDPHQIIASLRVAVAMAARRRTEGRNALVSVDLPAVGRTPSSDDPSRLRTPGYGRLVDLVGTGLMSTSTSSLTGLVRLPVPPSEAGVATIVETLDLGDVESQIVVDADGRFSPDRSTSNAERSDARRKRADQMFDALRRAEQARERSELLGEEELSERQRDAVEAADALRIDLG